MAKKSETTETAEPAPPTESLVSVVKVNPIRNIFERLHGVCQDVRYIQKEDKKVNNQYRFVSHDKVVSVVRGALIAHGIQVIPSFKLQSIDGNRAVIEGTFAFVNIDKPDDIVAITIPAVGVDNSDKGPGKAMSYATKYAYLKILNLETGDDPERDDLPYSPARPQPPQPTAETSGRPVAPKDEASAKTKFAVAVKREFKVDGARWVETCNRVVRALDYKDVAGMTEEQYADALKRLPEAKAKLEELKAAA